MGLEEDVRALLKQAGMEGRPAVPHVLQAISKERIRAVLSLVDRATDDMVDAVFALLDDQQPSWFSNAGTGLHFCHGATIAHIGAHVGILQRGSSRKLDREGRDYWVKPLCEVGAVERVTLLKDTGQFIPGHPIAKSPNSAYRLSTDFIKLLQVPVAGLESEVAEWIRADAIRTRLEVQARMAEEASRRIDSKHAGLIQAAINEYAGRFLSEYQVIYVDDRDGERISNVERARLEAAGLEFELGDAMPDVLLWRPGTNFFWVVEAVTSDGEVDLHKVTQVQRFIERSVPHAKVGYTTAYRTWRDAARRQGQHKNLAPSTYLWIQEDASKHFRVDSFQGKEHLHLLYRGTK
jgi:hypothetical protein